MVVLLNSTSRISSMAATHFSSSLGQSQAMSVLLPDGLSRLLEATSD